MSWFERLVPSIRTDSVGKSQVPEGLWVKCQQCDAVLYRAELERSSQVCPKCGFHHPMSALDRIELLLDEPSDQAPRENVGDSLVATDPLKFRDSKRYRERLSQASKAHNEALQVVHGQMHGLPVVLAAFNFRFMGGSMGSVVGERFVRGVQTAIKHRAPFICVTTSGGARMQEALISLFQMAKTSAALARLADAGLPYVVVLTHPTTGGVSASLAMLGDIHIAEPNALIGFAGPRVIEQTVKQTLPEGFQRSEFLLEHGVVDRIVDRRELKAELYRSLCVLLKRSPQKIAEPLMKPEVEDGEVSANAGTNVSTNASINSSEGSPA